MFKPKYSISDKLAQNMRSIGELMGEVNGRNFSSAVLASLEHDARVLSSFSSNRIEGNPLPLTDVKRILKSTPSNIGESEIEILNYNKALEYIHNNLKQKGNLKISNEFICRIQSKVMDKLIGKNKGLNYRNNPVFVNDPIKKETIYLPPDSKDVSPLMDDLISFVEGSKGEVDPLIIAGVFHKEFVIIHPFLDGNGRTARLITKTILAQLGLNTFQLFSFENYYNNNIAKYYENVGVFGNYYDIVDEVDFSTWLEFFTEGIINELERVKSLLPKYKTRIESHQKVIIDYIKENGSISMGEYSKITKRARATRIQDFKKLVEMKIIVPKGNGKSTYYVLVE
ncbi:MAG: Fic family protein [Candidatus Dojkabacteria bacterium]|nr:Fic family protein [Candidatus Dojkabacteria bacterium]